MAPNHPDLPRLCQALLNRVPDPAEVGAAEAFLRAALAASGEADTAAEPPGVPWSAALLPDPADPDHRRRALRDLAPTLLLDGVWLARVAQPASGHRVAEGHLLALYCRIVGLDDPARSPPLRCRAGLAATGPHPPPLEAADFFRRVPAPEITLRLPALHLALSHRPRAFFPELLGYTLAHVFREPAWWDPLPEFFAEARRLALAAWAAHGAEATEAERIRAGWALYRREFAALLREIGERLAREASAEDVMATLLRAKLPEAVGHHHRVRLQGRPLDEWLTAAAADPRPLLRALRASPWVDPAHPALSRLVRAMEFGGPMFGVFDAAERRACLYWIENPEARASIAAGELAADAGTVPAVGATVIEEIAGQPPDNSRPIPPDPPFAKGKKNDTAPSPRRLYTELLRAESPADVPPAAEAFARRILYLAAGLDRLAVGPWPRDYTPEGFHARIAALHRRELARYRPPAGAPRLGREFCRWAALQLAPAILVDGAWLAGVGTAAESLGGVGRHLLRIYADELGDGRADWNHPNVYRRLLASLDHDLPPFDRDSFAADPRFLAGAFDLPVYLLAMGQCCQKYLPEVLGLNLAIELSGLGAGYMGMIDILRHHGIDPTILQLHLSIDNLASGHAARAREAIDLHLDAVSRLGGEAAARVHWRRIVRGYLSLRVAAFRLAAGLGARHLAGRSWAGFGPAGRAAPLA